MNSFFNSPEEFTNNMLNKMDKYEAKRCINELNKGICYSCGTTNNIYLCSNCHSIMFCLDCQEKVLYKHQDKCSILLQTKNRSLTTNKIITPILMTYQLELMEFLYNQIIIQKKSSCFFFELLFP